MKIGASTLYGILSRTPLEAASELKNYGIAAVEIMQEYRHDTISKSDSRKMRKLDLDYSVHLPFQELCFAHPNPEIRKACFKQVRKGLEIAAGIGAKECVMHGGKIPQDYLKVDGRWNRISDFLDFFSVEFDNVMNEADYLGINVFLENMSQKEWLFGEYGDFEDMRIPDAGFCLDIPHSLRQGHLELYLKNKKIDHVHISDSRPGYDDHCAVGNGKLPLKEAVEKLKQKGYDGKVIVECFTVRDTLKSVDRLREW